MAQGQAASFKPSTFTEGGGLVGDIDVTFKSVRTVMWDYNGKTPTPSPAIKAVLVEESGEEVEQYWSCGQSKDWAASEDGKTLVAVGSATGINGNSNAGIFIASLVSAGFPESKIGDDVTVFDGLKAHVVRQATKREGLTATPRADGRTFEQTVLIVSKIHKLPWENAAGGSTQGAGTTGGTGGNGGGLEEYVQGVILEVLTEEGKPVPKTQLVTKVFQKCKAHPQKMDVVNLVHKDSFLQAGPWKLEGGIVSLG